MIGPKRYQIHSEQYTVNLKKNYHKINALLPAPQQTFVMIATLAHGNDLFAHIDQQANTLFSINFKTPVDSIAQTSPQQFVLLQPRQDQLTVVDISCHQTFEIPFNFLNQEFELSNLFTFSGSKSMCVVENGRYNDSRFRLSFFKCPLEAKSQPYHIYESEQVWNYQYVVKKGNEQSMILWFRGKQEQQIEMRCYSIEKGYRCLKVKNQVGMPYNYTGEIQLSIANAWEVEKDNFCLVTNSQKANLGLKTAQNTVNNNYYWNVDSNELRETTFKFDPKYADYLIDVHPLGPYSIFRTYFFQNGVVEESPVYYVHNQREVVVAEEKWTCSYLIKYEYPYQGSVVECEYENADVDKFKMRVKKIVEIED